MASGDQSYFGFEYQFVVSAWLMLMGHRNSDLGFSALKAETLFGQDAELLLGEVSSDDKSSEQNRDLNFSQKHNNLNLQVQVKTRGWPNQWRQADLRNVLLKRDETDLSGESSPTVLDRLVLNKDEYFFFVTDGLMSDQLNLLRDEDLSLTFEKGNFERELSDEQIKKIKQIILKNEKDKTRRNKLTINLTPEVIRKIHLCRVSNIEDIREKIGTILVRDYRIVPFPRAQGITQDLTDLIRNSALTDEFVSAQELEKLIGAPFPIIPYIETAKTFQEVPAYLNAQSILKNQHLLILTGEPAVGKTTIGRKLLNDYHAKGYQTEPIFDGSYREVYKACQAARPTIFLFDDPFGDNVFNGKSAIYYP